MGLTAVLGGLIVYGWGTAYRYLFLEKDESGRSLGEMLKNDPFELRVVIWGSPPSQGLVVSLIGLALGLLATAIIELAWDG